MTPYFSISLKSALMLVLLLNPAQAFADARSLANDRSFGGHKCATAPHVPFSNRGHEKGSGGEVLDGESVLANSLPLRFVSRTGRFTLHYDTAGINASTQSFIERAADLAEEAYRLSIDTLGFSRPEYSGSDSTYHLYFVALDTRFGTPFGYTAPADVSPNLGRSATGLDRVRGYCVFDNNYTDGIYRTRGDDALRITVFHEFHHLVQWGYGRSAGNSNFIEEMTSVWIETRSTPWCRDYIFDLDDYLASIDLSFHRIPRQPGYSQAVWYQFLSKRFGDRFIEAIWNHYRLDTGDPLFVHDISLADVGSSFCQEYDRFGAAIYATGDRSTRNEFFHDARYFPVYSLKTYPQQPQVAKTYNGAPPASLLLVLAGFGRDTTTFVAARSVQVVQPELTVTIPASGEVSVTSSQREEFCDTVFQLVSSAVAEFPQPYVRSEAKGEPLRILAWGERRRPAGVQLQVYSMSGTEIVRSEERASSFGSNNFYVEWDGRDAHGKPVPTGVYLYVVRADDQQREGKVVVIDK